MKRLVKGIGVAFGGVIGLALLSGVILYPIGMGKLTRSYPSIRVEALSIPSDPDSVVHGKHVASVWGCNKCHGENLGGILLDNDPFLGTIPASNLTSGEGGIAQFYSDADWIRAIRHGVKRDGRGENFMYEYSTMSDRDLRDLIAYLKQIPRVDSDYPAEHLGPILAVASAVRLFTPTVERIDHSSPRPADPVPGATIEYGKYLSAICFECHSPNLASKVGNWKQQDFIRAVRTGVLPNGKQLGPAMKSFGEMNDTELTALWYYFTNAKP